MDNIIVEICLAATGEIVDFMLPAHIRVEQLLGEIVRMVQQLHQELSYDEADVMLCDMNRGTMIPPERTLAQQQIRDGSRLMLV